MMGVGPGNDTMERRPLPPPTLATLNPPVRGHRYFDGADALPFDRAGDAQSRCNRWWLAEHALLAYDDAATVASALAPHGYATRSFFDARSNTFAYAAVADDHGVLVFRGTEALTPGDPLRKLGAVARDWLKDARCRHVAFDDCGHAHRGFCAALDAVWHEIEPVLASAPRWWCTGHSLGAALASLAALRMRRCGRDVVALVTFGQPGTGDASLAQALGGLPFVRVVNACDVVPRLPPVALGFVHAGMLVHLDADAFQRYGATVRAHVVRLPGRLRHGIGALAPVELIDHAPLHYAIKCFNAALDP